MDAAFYRTFWGLQGYFRCVAGGRAGLGLGGGIGVLPAVLPTTAALRCALLCCAVSLCGAHSPPPTSASSPSPLTPPLDSLPTPCVLPPLPASRSHPPSALAVGKWGEVSRDIRLVLDRFRQHKVAVGESAPGGGGGAGACGGMVCGGVVHGAVLPLAPRALAAWSLCIVPPSNHQRVARPCAPQGRPLASAAATAAASASNT